MFSGTVDKRLTVSKELSVLFVLIGPDCVDDDVDSIDAEPDPDSVADDVDSKSLLKSLIRYDPKAN